MKRSAPLIALTLVVGATGCAALGLRDAETPRDRLNQGVAALEARQYASARTHLEPLYFHHWKEPVGRQALLALIAAELDGRNPERRLWAAAEMATRLRNIPELEPWLVPVAESYYLLAQELGAAEQRIAQAEARAREADERSMPQNPRMSVPQQLQRAQAQVTEVRRENDRLASELAAKDKELKDTKAELERVRRTIRP